MLDDATIARYQSGGDIYAQIAAQYGQSAADSVAAAASSGDRGQITDALVTAIYGPNLDTSTFDAFAAQITTNPLGAPLAAAGTIAANTVSSFLTTLTAGIEQMLDSAVGNPLAVIAVGTLIYYLIKNKK